MTTSTIININAGNTTSTIVITTASELLLVLVTISNY